MFLYAKTLQQSLIECPFPNVVLLEVLVCIAVQVDTCTCRQLSLMRVTELLSVEYTFYGGVL